MTRQAPTPHFLQPYASALGTIWLAASEAGLSGLWFEGQKHQPDFSDSRRFHQGEHVYTQRAAEQLHRYFEDTSLRPSAAAWQPSSQLPLDLSAGTAFQQSVWQALLQIPAGSTLSYAALAQRIGKSSAIRAVGSAVGRNPISILVPCHRVIGTSGAMTGYAGGLERKIELLRREALRSAILAPTFPPSLS